MSEAVGRRGRPERALDRDDGPVAEFALGLRQLKEEAERQEGRPLDYRTLAERAAAAGLRRSHSVLADATKGHKLPSWETTQAFVIACGGDLAAWRARHATAAGASVTSVPDVVVTTPQSLDDDSGPAVLEVAPAPSRTGRFRPRGTAAVVVALVLLVVVAAGAAAYVMTRPAGDGGAAITVQNMVAIGADSLTEDTSPSYLSTRPVARCASTGCKVAGTEMASGIVLAAVCQVAGQKLTNADESSAGIQTNPHAARSDLWYGVQRPDGSIAYLSEVYVAPDGRGGLGLPECAAPSG